MKITIIAVGKDREKMYEAGVEEFASRISKYTSFEMIVIPTSDQKEENEKILKLIQPGDAVVILDEKGKEMSSQGLAQYIEKKLGESVKRMVFVIGGAYGFGPDFRDTLEQKLGQKMELSLSLMTFPHQLARLVLVEQIYRAFSIIRGEKYHHL